MGFVKIPLKAEDVTPEWLSQVLKVEIDPATFHVIGNAQEGAGFLSNLLRVSCNRKEAGTALNLVIKLLPVAEEGRSIMLGHHFDQTEIQMYQQLLPALCKAVPELELDTFLCKNLYSNFGKVETSDGNSEYSSVIILEDLKPLGFAILDPTKEYMSLQQLESGLDFLARFHCASKVVEKQKDKRLTELYSFLPTPAQMQTNSPFYDAMNQCVVAIEALLAEQEGPNSAKLRAEYKELMPLTKKMLDAAFFTQYDETSLCANHGDLWPNNVLFKKGTADIKIIDWQIVNYSETVRDVCVFILSSLSPADLTKANVEKLAGFYLQKHAAYCDKYQVSNGNSSAGHDLQTQFTTSFYGLGIFHTFIWFILSLEAYGQDIPRYLRCLEFLHVEMDAIGVVKRFLKI